MNSSHNFMEKRISDNLVNASINHLRTLQPNTRKYFELLKFIKANNLTLLKVDKGEFTVVMSRPEAKVLQFLHDAKAKPIRYGFKKHNLELRSALDKSSLIFGNKKDSLKVMCPATPRLYSQIKLHKEGHPIRPVVAYYTDPDSQSY